MKRDTYTVPRQRSRAWQWLAALMMAVFAVGSTSSASATSFNPRPFDVAHISAQSGCGAANAIVENGETITVTFGLTNKLSGNTLALVATLQSSANILNPSAPVQVTGDGASLGVVVKDLQGTVSFTFTVTGTAGTTIPAAIQLNDGVNNYGTITFNIPIGTTVNSTANFTNPAAITIGSTLGNATPYPSQIAVAGVSGNVTKVKVNLAGVTHTYPEDLQFLLVGPKGQSVILMADAGGVSGSPSVSAIDFSFDDVATSGVDNFPDETALATGKTYKTGNGLNGLANDDDNFLPPAVGPNAGNLTAFNSQDPNGTWSLFVNDDSLFNTGSGAGPYTLLTGGWSLNVTTSAVSGGNACTTTPTIVAPAPSAVEVNEDTVADVPVAVSDTVTAAASITLTVTGTSDGVKVPLANIIVTNVSGGNRTVRILPVTNSFTTDDVTISLSAKDGDGLVTTGSFKLKVRPVNDFPSIAAVAGTSTQTNTPVTVTTTVTDIEDSGASLQVFASSSSPIIPNGNISTSTSGNTRTITLTPAAGAEGPAEITLTVVDSGGGTATTSFTVVVGSSTGAPTISDLTAATGTFGGATFTANWITNNVSTIFEDASPDGVAVNSTRQFPTINFTVADAITAGKDLQVTATSDNPGLVLASGLVIGPSGPNSGARTLTMTLNANQFTTSQSAKITITVKDSDNNTTTKVLTLTVLPVNDRPTLAISPAAATINENTAAIATLTVDDVESSTALSITAVSDTQNIIPNANVGIVGTGVPGKFNLTALPVANKSGGPVVITVTVGDGTTTTTGTFTVTVNAVNNPPVFTAGDATITVNEDSGAYNQRWATGIKPDAGGSSDEAAQTVTFALINNSNAALFSVAPALNVAGTDANLAFTTATDKNGTATLTFRATDSGGASGPDFTITVVLSAVNEAPTFTAGPNITVNEDTAGQTNAWATAILMGPAGATDENAAAAAGGQTGTFVVSTVSGGDIFDVIPFVDSTGRLGFKPKANKSGVGTFKVKLVDNGSGTAPNVNTSTEVTFTVTVTGLDDAATLTGLNATYSTSKGTPSSVITFTVNDPDIADQSTLDVTVTPDGSFAGLFNPISLGKNGDKRAFIVTPINGTVIGSATVTFQTLGKNSAGANDGLNSSAVVATFTIDNVNNKPVITLQGESGGPSGTTNPSVIEDSLNIVYRLTVSDVETAASSISVTASSDNTTVIPNTGIFVASDGAGGRTLIITPAANQSSTNDVTITVSATDLDPDGAGPLVVATQTKTFKLTVTPVNDAPVISNLPAKTSTIEDIALTIPMSIADVDSNVTNITYTVSVNTNTVSGGPFNGQQLSAFFIVNPTIGTDPTNGFVVSGTGNNTTLKINPIRDLSGANEFKITAKDAEGANSTTIAVLLTVLATNDTPVITFASATVTHNEDPDSAFFNIQISDVETTPAWKMLNNASSPPSVKVSIIENAAGVLDSIFLDAGQTNETRRVHTPTVANKFGTAKVRVIVTDGGDVQRIPSTPDVNLPAISLTNDFTIVVNPVNDKPTITPIASLTTKEDVATPPLAFTIGDVETATSSLTVTASSSDTKVVADGAILLGGNAANRTVLVTPAANASGSAVITVTVSDGTDTSSTSFTLTVTPENDAPFFVTTIANQTTPESTDTPLISFAIGDAETPAGSLIVTGVSDNQALVPNANIFFGGQGANRALIITPVRNASGIANITLTISDGSLTKTSTFKLTVNGVNDLPTLSDIANQTVNQNTTLTGISFQVSDVETPAVFLSVTAKSSNTSIVSNDKILVGGSGTNRTMAIVPETDKSGNVAITVTVTDADGANVSKSFGLTINAVNQSPKISDIADVTTAEDVATAAIPFTVVDLDSASVTVVATSSNTGLVPATGIALTGTGTNWTIKITPAANQSGTATITVKAVDTEGLEKTKTFVVTVTSVNDAPSITAIANQTTRGGQAVSANFNVSDIETATTNLTVTAVSSNSGVVANSGIAFTGTGAIRTITITPSGSGSTTITVTVTDGEGLSKAIPFTVDVVARNPNDLNGDSLSDLVLQHSDGSLAVWFMNGRAQIGGAFLNPVNPGDPRWRVAGNGDFNGDGNLDIVFQHQDGTIGVWYMASTNLVSAAVLNPSSPGDSRWRVAATADVNKDGKEDLLFQHQDGTLAYWRMDGVNLVAGQLLTPSNPGDANWRLMASADFNNDGKTDLIFQHRVDRTLAVWYMNGATFVDSELLNPFDPTSGWQVAAAADFNGDGQSDLVFQHDIGSVQIWYMKGSNGIDRQFTNPVSPGDGWTVMAPR